MIYFKVSPPRIIFTMFSPHFCFSHVQMMMFHLISAPKLPLIKMHSENEKEEAENVDNVVAV